MANIATVCAPDTRLTYPATPATSSDPRICRVYMYRRRDAGKLVYDVRKLLEEYASVELWGADMVHYGTVTDVSDIWEVANGCRSKFQCVTHTIEIISIYGRRRS